LNIIQEGLSISAIGLAVAFLFMSVFILVIVVLQKLFPAEQAVEKPAEIAVESKVQSTDEGGDIAVVAAIAVAMSMARTATTSNLGSALDEGRSTWWIANRMNAQQDVGLQKFRRGTA
jgi:Na+-transporting methylmalonyl-CoA/oxaloacetate decarboxylase gamma subunit